MECMLYIIIGHKHKHFSDKKKKFSVAQYDLDKQKVTLVYYTTHFYTYHFHSLFSFYIIFIDLS